MGNYIPNFIKKPVVYIGASIAAVTAFSSKAVVRVFVHYDPDHNPTIEEINEELAYIGKKSVSGTERIKKIFEKESPFTKSMYDFITKEDIVSGSKKNPLLLCDGIDKMLKLSAHILKDNGEEIKFKKLEDKKYYTMDNDRKKSFLLEKGNPKLIIQLLNEKVDKIFYKTESCNKNLNDCLNNAEDSESVIIEMSKICNIGLAIRATSDIVSKTIIVLNNEADILKGKVKIGKDTVKSSYDYKNGVFKKWKNKFEKMNDGEKNEYLAKVISDYVTTDLNTLSKKLNDYNNRFETFHKNFKALNERIRRHDYDIISSIPDSTIESLKNNNILVLKRDGFNPDIITLDNLSVTNLDILYNEINRLLPDWYRLKKFFPPAPDDQSIRGRESSNKVDKMYIDLLFGRLGGFGSEKIYDNVSSGLVLSCDTPFTVCGDPKDGYTAHEWTNPDKANFKSRFNDKNDEQHGANDAPYKKGSVDKILKAPGPHFHVFGPYPSNPREFDKKRLKIRNDFMLELNKIIANQFINIGFNPCNQNTVFGEKKDESNNNATP